ncbi:DUF6311 domain-containing protein [Pantoea agglomerans]|uniref:DUF6311 domain-containing protein n=1 Tax=Enterobacter agglomerans TaxID=549 RepID=UPI00117CA438|nr:DUF6311 domain-containing protein [Pantoea agglomerans]NKE95523.1 hypothetical protein [Pantoea agglomerans]TRO77050.1 hypothetical protein E5140_02715 [Pantoea agglomerans]
MKINYYLISSGLIGLVFFCFAGGINTLDITNIGFLMSGDPAQHWLGWEFFRHTPILQWPIGKNTSYGIELNNSIVYTDSIPLLAIFFKSISSLLPATFQYTGIWILSCFILQGVSSFLLVKKLTGKNLYALLFSIIFISAVPFTNRTGGHFALSAHWIIIFSYFLYFSERFKAKSWVVLLCLSSWVHAYLLAMSLAIYFADNLNRMIKKDLACEHICKNIAICLAAVFFSMYAIGYFTISNSFSADGYGFYKLNLNSFINPYFEPYSSIIKPMPYGRGDYEGLNYIGFGVIIALFTIGFHAFKLKAADFKDAINNNKVIIIIVTLIFIYALSNNITIGKTTLISFYDPSFLKGITGTFRATGRFGWVVFYGILAFTAVYISKAFNGKTVIVIASIIAFLNVYDVHKIYKERRKSFTKEDVSYVIENNNVRYISKSYKKLLTPVPWSFSSEYVKWAYLASTNNMSMNFGYFARFNGDTWNKQTEEIVNAVNSGNLDKDAVYLLKDESQYKKLVNTLGDRSFNFTYGDVYIVGIKK